MNKYGKMILWMGLILMALQIAFEWRTIRNVIFTKGSGGGGAFTIPSPFVGPGGFTLPGGGGGGITEIPGQFPPIIPGEIIPTANQPVLRTRIM
jgi:hypothetical protein